MCTKGFNRKYINFISWNKVATLLIKTLQKIFSWEKLQNLLLYKKALREQAVLTTDCSIVYPVVLTVITHFPKGMCRLENIKEL